jgi:uncharacterized protein (TIGR03435 family)
MGMFLDAGRVEFKLMSLRDLILIAYRIKPFQLPGTPDWMTTVQPPATYVRNSAGV